MLKIYIPIALLFISSCSNNSSNDKVTGSQKILKKDSLPIRELFINTNQEDSWGADVRLSISEIFKTDTSITYIANSTYGQEKVGFHITIPLKRMAAEQVMLLQSSGENSDNLVRLLAQLYKEKIDSSQHFAISKRVAFIDLDEYIKKEIKGYLGDQNGINSLKVFFESENEDDNAEIFININMKEHWIEIKEKDEDYRKQVLKALTNNS